MLLPTAFVVEIEAADSTDLRGRIEHVLSGECGRFDSAAALVEFMRCALDAPDPTGLPDPGKKGSVR